MFGVSATLVALALVATVLVGPAAATTTTGAADPGVTNTWNVQVGVQSADGAFQGMGFIPRKVYINAGDTVNWQANSIEIHTVTFPATEDGTGGPPGLTTEVGQTPRFDQTDPLMTQPHAPEGSNGVYDGENYYTSGVMGTEPGPFGAITDYSLTFPTPGTYKYLCLVHGATEVDEVIVAPAGTPYPHTQAEYDEAAVEAAARVTRDGEALLATTAEQADDHTVIMGADSMVPEHEVMVMKFIQPHVTVRAGETVSFKNDQSVMTPHTVTFGQPPADPAEVTGDPTAYSGGPLNSGIAPPAPAPGSTFDVTFTEPGTYDYICMLHADMGMVGQVEVLPASAPAPGGGNGAAPAMPVNATPTFTG